MRSRDHFRVLSVEVLDPHRLSLQFGDGARLTVDLTSAIEKSAALSPLKDADLFAQAGIDEWGLGVSWRQGELGLSGDNLRAEAIEQAGGYSHERIWNWMHRNGLSLDAAAKELGISRRMLAYYRSGEKPVPRHIWLACVGWEAEREHAAA